MWLCQDVVFVICRMTIIHESNYCRRNAVAFFFVVDNCSCEWLLVAWDQVRFPKNLKVAFLSFSVDLMIVLQENGCQKRKVCRVFVVTKKNNNNTINRDVSEFSQNLRWLWFYRPYCSFSFYVDYVMRVKIIVGDEKTQRLDTFFFVVFAPKLP